MFKPTTPARHATTPDIDERGDRRTVIPTPRTNAMFSGWGVRF